MIRTSRFGGFNVRKPKEVNKRTCTVCGAKPGETCFILGPKSFRELSRVHVPENKMSVR